ncbi:MAG: FAD-binding oxidoreductase [Anaerolineae bacterium]|nr:FAD-binding oxidoreductase [Anaerolineae bacterium]
MSTATADVLIIGGGPAGTAAAWALGRADPTLRIALLERGAQLGSGASNASLENYRTAWPAACLMRLMTRSLEVFENADELIAPGAHNALGMRQPGYLYVGFTERQVTELREDVEHLHSLGLEHIEWLNWDEVQRRFPWVGPRVRAAKYDPRAGWLDSNAMIQAFARGTMQMQVLFDCADVVIETEGGRVRGARYSGGRVDAPRVVIAAGAWSRPLGRTAGIEIPVHLVPRQSFTTPWRHEDFPLDAPLLISSAPFAHVRPEAQHGALFGFEYRWNTRQLFPDEPAREHLIDPVMPPERCRDPRFPSATLLLLARQFGHDYGEGFASPRYLRGVDHRVGYYVSRDASNAWREENGERIPVPSQRAIIDAWPELEGLVISVAHVGHGIMSAPAAGELAAAHVLGRDLPCPEFADLGLNVNFVEHDSGGLTNE